MYEAKGDCVYYIHPDNDTTERFLTVHPTKDCTATLEEQAITIAELLNEHA